MSRMLRFGLQELADVQARIKAQGKVRAHVCADAPENPKKRGPKPKVKLPSSPEELLALQIAAHRLPAPEREYRFHAERKWRFDFAWPGVKLACEVEGGIWINGAHNRGGHFESDAEKYNEAAFSGLESHPGQLGHGQGRSRAGVAAKGAECPSLTLLRGSPSWWCWRCSGVWR